MRSRISPVFNSSLAKEIILEKEHYVPGSLHFQYQKYCTPCGSFEHNNNSGELYYSYASEDEASNKLQLKFCYTGKRYCPQSNCEPCRQQRLHECSSSVDTCYLFSFKFNPLFLHQFTEKNIESVKNDLLNLSYRQSFQKNFYINERKKYLLDKLKNTSYCSALQNVTFNAIVQELLLSSLQEVTEKREEVFACRFLADATAKEKMYEAKRILLQNIGASISIKELSKKVATNECYLKKGFKEVFGVTIYDFYLQQKMEHAKFLLYEEKMTVTDVAITLGYSSISHFSSAFKRQTGLKPCELLR